MLKVVLTLCILLFYGPSVPAQVLTQATRFAAPGESERKKTSAAGASESGINPLPQASVNSGSTAPEISLEAADLYMTSRWRMYIRTTLPIKPDPAPANGDAGSGSSVADGSSAAKPEALKPNDHQIAALFDPYGGLLNTSLGYYGCVVPWAGKQCEREGGLQPDHGLFIDSRVGMKFIDLPVVTGSSAPRISDVSVTPFYTGVLGLKFIAPLFNDPETTSAHLVGGLTVGASYVISRVADSTLSDLFKSSATEIAPLDKTNHNVTIDVAVNLGGITALSMSGTPWASDSRLGKRFVVGLSIARPTRTPEPAAEAPFAVPDQDPGVLQSTGPATRRVPSVL